ncbi:OadG family protein [Congregibacter litoralis]|uniref:Probable oxaloacetate decarboxylase gamma chain n=1 Tax=Congregibacter litoralis KT71 TaxID=314285 RepID=A4AAB1_9GAMM|nr:OadG family protein [Congregibacter litoralis]EAQ96988.1 sodium pump decarboxylase, gamma subunit [Congregibacter litoralis KT71]
MGASLLSQGIELLIYGMGTVVVFLTLLVFATRVMSRTIQRFFPEPPIVVPQRVSAARGDLAPAPELLAAISAAVHQHRRHRAAESDPDQRNSHV